MKKETDEEKYVNENMQGIAAGAGMESFVEKRCPVCGKEMHVISSGYKCECGYVESFLE